MNDNRSSDHGEGSVQFDERVFQLEFCWFLVLRLHYVTQITDVSLIIVRSAVRLAVGIVVRSGSNATLML